MRLITIMVLGLLLSTQAHAREESNMFQKSASCAMISSIAGDDVRGLKHAEIALLVLDERELAFWGGRASGITELVAETTKKPRKIIAQTMYKNMNCKAILAKKT